MAFLRELSGEAAYARHLLRQARQHSASEWRRFSACYLGRKYSNPKCC